jgi:hypothetical protein
MNKIFYFFNSLPRTVKGRKAEKRKNFTMPSGDHGHGHNEAHTSHADNSHNAQTHSKKPRESGGAWNAMLDMGTNFFGFRKMMNTYVKPRVHWLIDEVTPDDKANGRIEQICSKLLFLFVCALYQSNATSSLCSGLSRTPMSSNFTV